MAHITGTDRAQVLLPPDTVDDYVGPDFPSPLDEQLTWKKTIQLTLAALLGLSGALPAAATEYQASDYLPVAVGNSWTYDHDYYDIEKRFGDYDQWSAYFAQESSEFTIEVLRTEELDGQTYYVISEMPSNWPPPPPHFIAGKKLRWSGAHLMEHSGSGEQAIFRFDGHGTSYDIPTVEGDNRGHSCGGAQSRAMVFFPFP